MRKRWKRAIAVMMFAAVMVSGCGSNTAKKSSEKNLSISLSDMDRQKDIRIILQRCNLKKK